MNDNGEVCTPKSMKAFLEIATFEQFLHANTLLPTTEPLKERFIKGFCDEVGGLDGLAALMERETQLFRDKCTYLMYHMFFDVESSRMVLESKPLLQVLISQLDQDGFVLMCVVSMFRNIFACCNGLKYKYLKRLLKYDFGERLAKIVSDGRLPLRPKQHEDYTLLFNLVVCLRHIMTCRGELRTRCLAQICSKEFISGLLARLNLKAKELEHMNVKLREDDGIPDANIAEKIAYLLSICGESTEFGGETKILVANCTSKTKKNLKSCLTGKLLFNSRLSDSMANCMLDNYDEHKKDFGFLAKSCAGPSCKVSSTKLKKCSRCQVVFYCSTSCQKNHWKKEHKKSCVQLKK